MCLLIMLAQTHTEFPLVVAANRDEQLERPAVPMTVLHDGPPQVLGGRDELAGGTWLAVNEFGVVAGLTNRPVSGPVRRDPTKRSRGELPLALASCRSASAAVDRFVESFKPADFNPSWLLVGDRDSAYAIDMTTDESPDPVVVPLAPGVHVLENRAFGVPSPKVDHVRALLDGIELDPADSLPSRLVSVVSDHDVPAGYVPDPNSPEIPPQVKAACVHTDRYGTRWSGLVIVGSDPAVAPAFRYADGPPCSTPWSTTDSLWR